MIIVLHFGKVVILVHYTVGPASYYTFGASTIYEAKHYPGLLHVLRMSRVYLARTRRVQVAAYTRLRVAKASTSICLSTHVHSSSRASQSS